MATPVIGLGPALLTFELVQNMLTHSNSPEVAQELPALPALAPHLPETVSALVSRRTFVRWGFGGVLFLGAAGCLPKPAPSGPGGIDPAWTAIARRICAGDDPTAPDPLAVGTLKAIARAIGDLPPDLRRQIAWAVRAVDWSGISHGGARFHRLGPIEQDQVLAAWMKSRFTLRRTVFRALKELCMLSYYGAPETWPAIGYDGPWS